MSPRIAALLVVLGLTLVVLAARAEAPQSGLAVTASVAGGWTNTTYRTSTAEESASGPAFEPRGELGYRFGRFEVGGTMGTLLARLDTEFGGRLQQPLFVLHMGAYARVRPSASAPVEIAASLEAARALFLGPIAAASDQPPGRPVHLAWSGVSGGGLAKLAVEYTPRITQGADLVVGAEALAGWTSGDGHHLLPRALLIVVGTRWD